MIDRPFGDSAAMLRSPDLRLGGIRTELVRVPLGGEHVIDQPNRAILIFARTGDFEMIYNDIDRTPVPFVQSSVAGCENGCLHRWRAVRSGCADGMAELFVSSIPRRQGVLQRLDQGMLIVPPDTEPFATIFRHAVEIHLQEYLHPNPEDGEAIIRRCAEICMIEFVRYARLKVGQQPDVPASLAHDESMLRAWSAYFADPQRRWTVQALADAAGLGRTVFIERFRRIFGAPPLQTLTQLRLEQAEAMLRDTRAPLIEIAFTVGYNSEAAFVRAFHRQYGMPPGRFRSLRQAT